MTPQVSPAKAPRLPNKQRGEGWTFSAPRYGDLVGCPYCTPDTPDIRRCDQCGDEGVLFASEVFQ